MTNYKCLNCEREFQVKEYFYQDGIVVPQQCPFCGFYDIEESAMCEANSNAVLAEVRAVIEKRHMKEYSKLKDEQDEQVIIFRSGLKQGLNLALLLIDNYLYHKS